MVIIHDQYQNLQATHSDLDIRSQRITFTVPSLNMNILSGFRSRCITPSECKYLAPSTICMKTFHNSSSVYGLIYQRKFTQLIYLDSRFLFAMSSCRSPLSAYSRTIKNARREKSWKLPIGVKSYSLN